ncbi:uncharacterized protein LOC103934593 isoform X2 [Pyrus x bretschneideri]|uniref:uncharacterized protein LOC103934593 isoform X2 n=1 Tax=Pyrus x bretschneideri TaxID=225117 RepID=UPI00202E1B6E|nr:uncharacterized protein LOC103934593 isoform X2 [Pyrus x bretschneideri]
MRCFFRELILPLYKCSFYVLTAIYWHEKWRSSRTLQSSPPAFFSSSLPHLAFPKKSTRCINGENVGESDLMDTEVYEIDYRGPETHSSVPPPGHSHGKKRLPLIHKENAMATPKPKSIEGANMGRKVKKVHG